MKYVNGDLIELALNGEFDLITHGCNCFCKMGSGIAVPMKNTFHCDRFYYEGEDYIGDINKLGCIDYNTFYIQDDGFVVGSSYVNAEYEYILTIVNSYTQYKPGVPNSIYNIPLDYDALRMCFRKINHEFKGKHLGIPQIGCGLAGGDWNMVEQIIDEETPDLKVTCVIYKK